MPLSKYNKSFGGKAGSAAKAHAAMVQHYGEQQGERVFYATMNAHKGGGTFDPSTRPSVADVHDTIAPGDCLCDREGRGIEHFTSEADFLADRD